MLVNTAPSNFSPRMRSCTIECDDTSMKQYSHPASTISRSMALSRTASGVVCVDSVSRFPTR